MLKEFHHVAVQDDGIDLPIGVTSGAAFGAIVSSLGDGVAMPVVDLGLSRIGFSRLSIDPGNPNSVAVSSPAAAREAGVAMLNIGLFINAVVKFLIVAFVLFLVVKGINTIRNEQAAAPPA